jgi:hypothetical protein
VHKPKKPAHNAASVLAHLQGEPSKIKIETANPKDTFMTNPPPEDRQQRKTKKLISRK